MRSRGHRNADLVVNSCLYECTVMHHRLTPRKHHFRYRIFMFALDLDEIDAVAARLPMFSRNRANLYTFRDRDHVTLPELDTATTKQNVLALLSRHGIATPSDARITLVTLPRVMGYVFNPVSFYFCVHRDGTPLCAVAEVSNTFGEMKSYVLRECSGDGPFRLVTPKYFYVSPFCDLDVEFHFTLRVPGERLDIHIDDREGDERAHGYLLTTSTRSHGPAGLWSWGTSARGRAPECPAAASTRA